ncbi:MAG: bifunctional tetrahydrofolate synthase/dihydrofolate synthase [Pseudomonadales bacterium]
MTERDLDAWQQRLATLHPQEIELGLDRVAKVANRLNYGALAERRVSIAGTNGKGSTIATLERLLLDAGQSVGVYTSPHLMRYNERVRINGEYASDADLCTALTVVDAAREDTPLTYFEFTTLAAFYLFAQQPLAVVLLEVGLGGRLDAVNIIDADIAVITSIAIDHEDWLGDNREAIAIEKAGILRSNIAFVCADRAPPNALRSAANTLNTQSYFIGEQFDYSRHADDSWTWQSGTTTFENLPLPDLHLDCAAAALQVFMLLDNPVSAAELNRSLANCHLPGRLQQLDHHGISIVLDVAHNPAAAMALAEQLRRQPWSGKTQAVFAVLSDKNWPAMLTPLQELVDSWFLAELITSARAETAAAVADELRERGQFVANVSENPCQALRQALSIAQTGDRVLVFGSFHTVGPVLELLQDKLETDDNG